MLSSGSVPTKAIRDSMWAFLLLAGAAWLAIAWTVMRIEPTNIATVAGLVLLFGALCEALRALAGMKTWWLNAAMAALFAVTAAIQLSNKDFSYTTPESLLAWFLMVRGAMDIAVSIMNRGIDRTWGLIVALGTAQAGLGFLAASPWGRTADPVLVTMGALAMLRAIADLATALRLREVAHAHQDLLHLPPERQAGVTGYAAGLSDYPATQPAGRARHRATGARATGLPPAVSAHPRPEESTPADDTNASTSFHDEVLRTTANLDTTIAQAGVTGTGTAAHRVPEALPKVPDTIEGVASHEAAPTPAESALSTDDVSRQ